MLNIVVDSGPLSTFQAEYPDDAHSTATESNQYISVSVAQAREQFEQLIENVVLIRRILVDSQLQDGPNDLIG